MKYAIINTEFFVVGCETLPVGTVMLYETNGKEWKLHFRKHTWIYSHVATTPRYGYRLIKDLVTIVSKNNKLVKLVCDLD